MAIRKYADRPFLKTCQAPREKGRAVCDPAAWAQFTFVLVRCESFPSHAACPRIAYHVYFVVLFATGGRAQSITSQTGEEVAGNIVGCPLPRSLFGGCCTHPSAWRQRWGTSTQAANLLCAPQVDGREGPKPLRYRWIRLSMVSVLWLGTTAESSW